MTSHHIRSPHVLVWRMYHQSHYKLGRGSWFGWDWYFTQPQIIWSPFCLYFNETKTSLTSAKQGSAHFKMGSQRGAEMTSCQIDYIWGKCDEIMTIKFNLNQQPSSYRIHRFSRSIAKWLKMGNRRKQSLLKLIELLGFFCSNVVQLSSSLGTKGDAKYTGDFSLALKPQRRTRTYNTKTRYSQTTLSKTSHWWVDVWVCGRTCAYLNSSCMICDRSKLDVLHLDVRGECWALYCCCCPISRCHSY